MRRVFPYIRKNVWVLYASSKDSKGRSLVMEISTHRDVVVRRRKELEALNEGSKIRFCIVRYRQER